MYRWAGAMQKENIASRGEEEEVHHRPHGVGIHSPIPRAILIGDALMQRLLLRCLNWDTLVQRRPLQFFTHDVVIP